MKTNKDQLKAAMDRRLSFLDDVPSCRAKVQYRIAQKEEPVVMKKKLSVGLVLAMILVLLSVSALAAGLLLSSRVTAAFTSQPMHTYALDIATPPASVTPPSKFSQWLSVSTAVLTT